MSKVFFTRDGNRVHIQSNPEFCPEDGQPVDLHVGPEENYLGITYSVLRDAGAGEIEIEPDSKAKIVSVSQDRDDKIYSWSSADDSPLWHHQFDGDPCVMMPFVDDYETSSKKYYDQFK